MQAWSDQGTCREQRDVAQLRVLVGFLLTTGYWLLTTVSFRACDQCGQATKGVWGMSRRQKAKKGVEDCDKPGEVVKRALIPGYPN
jgi:hypothetical protein